MATIEACVRSSGLPPLEARLLLAHVLGVTRGALAARSNDELPEALAARVRALFERRRCGEPVAYLTGEREFYGRRFAVTPAVLIPRPETELLVETVLACLPSSGTLLDLGTGSGAIAITVALERPVAAVSACDVSREALEVARANAAALGARVELRLSDWFSAFAGCRFDVIACNPPYVAPGDPHLEELRYEPLGALVAGASAMSAIEAVARGAREHLAPAGWLVLEHGFDQGETCTALLLQLGYRDVRDLLDLAGVPRVVVGRFDRGERAV